MMTSDARQTAGWQWRRADSIRTLLRHRELLWQMVSTDLRGRYVGSVLGLFWSVIHPLVLVGIYTVVFSRVMGARLSESTGPYDYSVYLCAGLLPWIASQEIVMRSTTVFFDQANLVKKVAFPWVLLHASIFGAAAINLSLLVTAFIVFLLLIGASLHAALWLWPFFLLLHLFFVLGLGLLTSVLNVFFRDTAQIVSVCLQLWFWLTPIVYPAGVLPEAFSFLLDLNPLYLFTRVHQGLALGGRLPSAAETAVLAAISLATLATGYLCVRRLWQRIPDEL